MRKVRKDKDYLVSKKRQKAYLKKNRDRAKRMESNIAKKWGGKRIAYSGAGVEKSDVVIPVLPEIYGDNSYGYLVEAKLSQYCNSNGYPVMPLTRKMLEQLFNDVSTMQGSSLFTPIRFGVLAFHYVNYKGNYVLVPDRYWSDIEDLYNIEINPDLVWKVGYYKNGKPHDSYRLPLKKVRESLGDSIDTPSGKMWILFERDWLDITSRKWK